LTRLYSDCQTFAEKEINSLLDRFEQISAQLDKPGVTLVAERG
jgi:hypothetical protein